MSKRKTQDDGNVTMSSGRGEEESSDEDMEETLDVDFEFFDPKPETDFHGLKSLCRQLFDLDAQLFNLSELIDLILSQPLLGSTVKCNGMDSDPYAFLTVLNLHQHKDVPAIKTMIQYLISKSSSSSQLSKVEEILSSQSSKQFEVGLILAERLLNVPPEVIPPMFTMLVEEIEWANQAKEPYTFSHYLILSKTYKEVESEFVEHAGRSSKKQKKDKVAADNTFYFHPEDEVLQRFAMAHGNFGYSSVPDSGRADSKRVFQDMGIVPQGHMILIERSKFEEAIKAVSEFLTAG